MAGEVGDGGPPAGPGDAALPVRGIGAAESGGPPTLASGPGVPKAEWSSDALRRGSCPRTSGPRRSGPRRRRSEGRGRPALGTCAVPGVCRAREEPALAPYMGAAAAPALAGWRTGWGGEPGRGRTSPGGEEGAGGGGVGPGGWRTVWGSPGGADLVELGLSPHRSPPVLGAGGPLGAGAGSVG